MVVAKKYVFNKYFEGEPKEDNLSLVEVDLPPIKEGEILIQAEYLSVDPYMRPYSSRLELGTTMIGSQVAKIIESKNSKWPVGKRIFTNCGWTTHSIINPDEPSPFLQIPNSIIPDYGDLPASLALGMLGMPGNTAYFGFLEICKPKTGETVVVSGAAGAVGSHVGQIAKILGLQVIGIAGTDKKCKWLVDELNFDQVINYKAENIDVALKKAAPKGVDCYFDNVGGEISSIVIQQMNDGGRISVCGSISSYNSSIVLPKATILQPAFVFKQLKMEGFLVLRWTDRFMEGIEKNLSWLREGKLLYKETVTEGFENTFKAFAGMLKGENIGKAIVKV